MDRHSIPRNPTRRELKLLKALIAKARNLHLEAGWAREVKIASMADGGMGSFQIVPPMATPYRIFGGTVSRLDFVDSDGVDVSVVLNVDQNGLPFEVDVWKTDFTPVISIPWRLT